MAKKNNKSNDKQNAKSFNFLKELKQETLHGVIAIIFFAITLFLILASIKNGAGDSLGGPVGGYTFSFFEYLLGIGYFLLPVTLVILGISFWKTFEQRLVISKFIGGFLFLLSGLGLISLASSERGGLVGSLVANPLVSLFDTYATSIFLVALLAISTFIMFDTKISLSHLSFLWPKKNKKDVTKNEDMEDEEIESKIVTPIKPEIPEPEQKTEKTKNKTEKTETKDATDSFSFISVFKGTNKAFNPPPLSLLELDKGKPGVGDIKANANIIKRTLQNFGIDVEMDEISIGPSVTRYALKPAEGVKLARIVGLQSNLSLALAAHPIRIEAPIPGKSLVGIEIPNSIKTTVGLGSLLSQEEFQKSEKSLLVSLGKGISGKSHFANMAKMPHMLIAGATGSGKSVTIHAIITSLLYRNSPENLRFIMIDPKRVELTMYNKIPHLLTPVITDAKKAILALKWAAKEMDRRYDILEQETVRDIESYHKNVLAPKLKKAEKNAEAEIPETMPYIVVIIDELADIMATYPRELESAIVRLAQMSRAVGIHLMLSTQRPSVNVITGLIKANIPARVALQVASQIDSRTILDSRGAEELLGAGDMLYLSGEMSSPQRIQSAYITEAEVKNVVSYLINEYKDALPTEINIAGDTEKNNTLASINLDDNADVGDDDDLYEEAREIITKAGKASTSYLQRKLRIGYARAARLMDILEERGVIGPGDGAKPREVIGFIPEQAAAEETEEVF
ncbi:MAG: DNA translocase FtsK 4TM domain-containing protein [bacterium]